MDKKEFQKKEDTNLGRTNEFLSPRQLAMRWDCSRTTAQRIADRVGIAKYYLGEGRNGMVRYLLREIEGYEDQRRIG